MTATLTDRPLAEQALEVFRRAGNPFRNYFARNPDDEVCSRYHVPELYALQREQLLGVVDLYRYSPTMHCEVVPILGNKGAGKTHLLHSIKHGSDGTWQLLVTPGVYQKDTDFLEYLLFQLIDTLLGGGKQKNTRPMEYVAEQLVRKLFADTLVGLSQAEKLEVFPAPGLGRWARKLGLGTTQALERVQWLIDTMKRPSADVATRARSARQLTRRASTRPRCCLNSSTSSSTAPRRTTPPPDAHGTSSEGCAAESVLLGDESDLATFLTYGFAELEFQVRPSRQELVLALFKAIMGVLQGMHIPVVFAFDQLEDLLLARRNDDAHRVAEAFFAGIVQAMHQLDGIAFLVFAERGLWNRFVPSLDGYIQDRLNNPIHLPSHGTLQAAPLLEAPSGRLLVRFRVVEARLRRRLEQLADGAELGAALPVHRRADQLRRVHRADPARHAHAVPAPVRQRRLPHHRRRAGGRAPREPAARTGAGRAPRRQVGDRRRDTTDGRPHARGEDARSRHEPAGPGGGAAPRSLDAVWDQEVRAARRKLEPEGSLTGATRELQSGLGKFLQVCHDHGVKVGPWRMQHVVPEWTFGDHPTYGVLSIAQWVCKGGQPWRLGLGLFLGRGPAKPRDLQTKLSSLEIEPATVDLLILLRPEDDLSLSGKSKTLWQEAERHGRHARLEAVALDAFATLYAFPRILTCMEEGLTAGQSLPNLADLLQDKCEKLLEQVCMFVQG